MMNAPVSCRANRVPEPASSVFSSEHQYLPDAPDMPGEKRRTCQSNAQDEFSFPRESGKSRARDESGGVEAGNRS
jgi:hypothetical protein